MDGVELGGSDDFGQLLHVHGFDVDDIWGMRDKSQSQGRRMGPLTKALVANVKVPKIYPKIVGRDVGFLIRIDRD